MTKREKAMRGLACCATEPRNKDECWGLDCPYQGEKHCMTELHKDALEALADGERREEE